MRCGLSLSNHADKVIGHPLMPSKSLKTYAVVAVLFLIQDHFQAHCSSCFPAGYLLPRLQLPGRQTNQETRRLLENR